MGDTEVNAQNRTHDGADRPASAMQVRLCTIDGLLTDDHSYTASVAVEWHGEDDPARLREALHDRVARHETLRSRPRLRDGRWLVHVAAAADLPFEESEYPDGTDAEVAAAEAAARPLPSGQAPLRAHLLRIGRTRRVLVITAHRAAADEQALVRLVRELTVSDAGAAREPAAAAAAFPVRSSAEEMADYWLDQLGDGPEPALVTDFPRPSVQSFRGATHRLPLTAELTGRLRELGRREGVELPTVLLAGLVALLGGYTGRDEAVVGWQLPGPSTGQLGPADTLVVRAELAGARRWREILARVAVSVSAARAHAVPFDELVRLLAPPPDPGRRPVCQIGFETIPRPSVTFAGTPVRWVPVDDPVAVFDLHWTVYEGPAELSCAVQYAADLWRPGTVARLADTWIRILHAMAADPDSGADELELLSPRDADQLDRWNATARELPEPATVDALVEQWARRTPDRVALTEGDAAWTYADLCRRARQIARTLIDAGMERDRPVGIHLRRGADLVVNMLGVLLAGGGYVVLDPAHPAERLAYMVRDGGLAAVLTGAEVPAWLPGTGVPAIVPAMTAAAADDVPAGRSLADGLAAVMFTSGSTGAPKAVGIPHRGMVRLVTRTDYVSIRADDVLIHLGDPSFDITTFEVWGALCNGARVAVLPGGEPLGPEEVLDALADIRPTILSLTGTLFHRVVDLRPTAFRDLRHLFVVGEVMDPVRTRRVLREGPPGQLTNGYGPTENSTFTTCHRIDDLPGDAAVPIGSAITNTTLHVLDPLMRRVPIGFPGELYVGGAGLGRGYLGRPAITAERFVPDPFTTVPGGRLYRTGDLVRLRPDGTLDFLGRRDQQVKVRGYRIETGEVEAALLATGAIRECVVRAVVVSGDTRLVAYVSAGGRPEPRVADLVAELRRRLPGYLIPNHFVVLDELPTTSSGKLDVRALPGVAASSPVSAADRVAPRTATEQAVWDSWATVLEVREFGVHDNFFLLGGHSLLAIVAATEIGRRLHADVPARLIFDTRTVAGLAAEIERRRAEPADEPPDDVDDLVHRIEQMSREQHTGAEGNVR